LRDYLLNWTKIDFLAKDAALGTFRNIYLVGQDGNVYLYHPTDNQNTLIIENKNITKISTYFDSLFTIDNNGNIAFITDGMIYNFNTCAKEISITTVGEVFKLGCQSTGRGYGLYKLQCKSGNNTYTKLLDRYIIRNDNKCEWIYQNIDGLKVAISSDTIYTINYQNEIVYYTNDNSRHTIPDIKASDISVTKFGILYVVDENNRLYILNEYNDYKPNLLMDNVQVATPGVLNVPIYIDTKNGVYIPNFMVSLLE
jgi:hypothetical protein